MGIVCVVYAAFSLSPPGPPITAPTSERPFCSMWRLVSIVRERKMLPFDQHSTLETSLSSRSEASSERRQETVVPFPTPLKPTIVTT